MATFQISWNPTTKIATVATDGTAVPGGSTKVGTFHHDNDPLDERGGDVSHVLFQHVRDRLYFSGQQNMAEVTIVSPSDYIGVQKIHVRPTNKPFEELTTVKVGGKLQMLAQAAPLNASNQAVTWSSSATNVATVDSNGVVTGVAAGLATIKATSTDGSITVSGQSDVTVQA